MNLPGLHPLLARQDLCFNAALVITPNHVSFLDPPAVAAAPPRAIRSRVQWAGWVGIMYAGPLSRLVSRATRVFPVDPDRDLAGAIATARALLEQGQSLVWFPEGRRSPNGSLLPFRPGIGVLLEGQSCLVVPTVFKGTYEAWPSTKRLPRPGPVMVAFGRTVAVGELAAEGEGETEEARIRTALEHRLRDLASNVDTPDRLNRQGVHTGCIQGRPGRPIRRSPHGTMSAADRNGRCSTSSSTSTTPDSSSC